MQQPIMGAGPQPSGVRRLRRGGEVIVAVGIAVTVAFACGSKPAAPLHPKPPAGEGSGSASTGQGSASTGQGSASTAGSAPELGALATTCVYYVGTSTYYTCLAGGEGTCFHIGAACTPADQCMWDPAGRSYKTCAPGRSAEGKCAAWGAACAPASKCWFDPKDSLHRTCEQVTGGTCARYGALCSP